MYDLFSERKNTVNKSRLFNFEQVHNNYKVVGLSGRKYIYIEIRTHVMSIEQHRTMLVIYWIFTIFSTLDYVSNFFNKVLFGILYLYSSLILLFIKENYTKGLDQYPKTCIYTKGWHPMLILKEHRIGIWIHLFTPI
jgi:hypothetical protein